MIQKRERDHQHNEREADGKERNEGEKFAPQENFEGDFKIVF